MSAPPPPPPVQGSTNLPNGDAANGVRPVYRPAKAKVVDPLFRRKKGPIPRPGVSQKPPSTPIPNGHITPTSNGANRPDSSIAAKPQAIRNANNPLAVSGFSDPSVPSGTYQDLKIVTTKREVVEGLRHHILKFISDHPVDLRDQNEFLRPVRFHRRDPKAQQPGLVKEGSQDVEMDDEEKTTKEEMSKRKEARQREREANLAQIAPSAAGQKLNNFKKKTQAVYRSSLNAQDIKKRQIQYEEKLPWHIEDDADKHCYVGQYQNTQSNIHVALSLEADPSSQNARFRLIPLEKMYKFAPKSTQTALSIDEAEKLMKKQSKDPEFLRRVKESDYIAAKKDSASASRMAYAGPKAKSSVATGLADDDQDLDYEAEASDDEDGAGNLEDKDEDTKFAERRIKQDQRKANFFDNKDERQYDVEEEMEERMKRRDKELNKSTNKALRRREGNYNMASDSESDPFASSESSEAEEEIKKEAEDGKPIKEEGGSGASTKGTNTPAGRKEKHGNDRMKKSKLPTRPGSPNQSEASGTESTASRQHLKTKKNAGLSSTQPTPQPPSRPTSPGMPSSSAPNLIAQSKKRKTNLGGAGSDSDGAATSDGGRKRTKLSTANGARPSSPPVPALPNTPATTGPFPTADEIRNVIPAHGMETSKLIKQFKGRAYSKDVTKFVEVAKSVAWYDKQKKLWMRLDDKPKS